ncbi:MAG: hypothetical protein A2Y07_02090 [Planctomycetes bacterium GWF2_50_10]|nr:MAG: hypothetical protein A2Y07_02090 [Planctomycetes bacterium GWF2_50_10]
MNISKIVVTVLLLSLPQFSHATVIDLTTANSSGVLYGAIFKQINADNPGGSGVFDSFLRIQKDQVEHGYNTNGKLEFDTKAGAHTHALSLADIPVVMIGSVAYREFCLDINQNGQKTLSLDELKIHIASAANLTEYPTNSNFGPAIYNLDQTGDNLVTMDYTLNPGSGKGDVVLLVPSVLFGTDTSKYVYLYSKLGVNLQADDGFEEWGIGEGGTPIIPEPATLAILSLGSVLMATRRKK